jgi:hypothetical protein
MITKETLDYVIRDLEERYDLTHLALIEEYPDGRLLFTCQEREIPSILTIDADSWVLIKNNDSQFYDVLGSL